MDAGYLLETFLENTPDHVYFKDLEGRFTRISVSLVRWLGVDDMTQALGRSDIDFFDVSHAGALARRSSRSCAPVSRSSGSRSASSGGTAE